MAWVVEQRGVLVLSLVAGLLATGCANGAGGTTAPESSTTVVTTTLTTTTTSPETTTSSETTTSTETAPVASPVLDVPEGSPPSVDGTIEPGEWDGAAITLMDDGSEIAWLYSGGAIYVGIAQHTIGAVNVLVADGNRIRVLHSSAALGSALFTGDGEGTWHLDRGYEWCCRTNASGRAALLAAEGWDANIGFAGQPGHVEYLIEADPGELLMAVCFIGPDGPEAFWPADLPMAARESLYGVPQDQETFATDTWMRVVVGG